MHIDRTRTIGAKRAALTRRQERRVKSAALFLAWAFPAPTAIDRFAR